MSFSGAGGPGPANEPLCTIEWRLPQPTAEAKAQAAEAEALAQSAFLALDPLLFAIPKGTSLEDESPAIVGPAWGQDFSDALLMVSGLRVIADQRKNLKENGRGSY